MFTFDVEGQEWGMKPMNCPGHCLMFAHRYYLYIYVTKIMIMIMIMMRKEI